jgi:hypothetical protein
MTLEDKSLSRRTDQQRVTGIPQKCEQSLQDARCFMVHCNPGMISAHRHQRREKTSMYRIITALFALVASAATASAQGLSPSVWKGDGGAILKVLRADSATGNFSGVFLSNPSAPCPVVPYDLAGRTRGPRVAFQTSRTWTSDCRATAVWSGRFVNPTTVATRWTATSVGPDGRPVTKRGTEVFRRI